MRFGFPSFPLPLLPPSPCSWISGLRKEVEMKRFRSELGQTTAEYALVLLAAAAVAVALYTWASQSSALTNFFASIITKISGMVS